MPLYAEVEPFGQSTLELIEVFLLFDAEIRVFRNSIALLTHEYVMMFGFRIGIGKLISRFAITEFKFGDNTDLCEKRQSPVNGRQTYFGVLLMNIEIDLFGADELRGCVQLRENNLSRRCYS